MSGQLTTERLREIAEIVKQGCTVSYDYNEVLSACSELLAKREECERKHQDGWAWLQLSQQREAERDAVTRHRDDLLYLYKRDCETMAATGIKETLLHDAIPALAAERDAARAEAENLTKDRNGIFCDLAACVLRADKATADAKLLQGIIDDAELESGLYDLQIDEAAMEELPTLPDFVRGMRAEAERLRSRLREANQTLVACIGADGPDTAEEAAKRAVEEIEKLRAELAAVKRQRDEAGVKLGELATWARGHAKNSERWETYQLEVWRVVATEIGSAIKMLALASQPAQQPKPAAPSRSSPCVRCHKEATHLDSYGRPRCDIHYINAKRDWPEDAADSDNGSYQCRCVTCGESFVGHKRRVTCKACAQQPKPEVQP